MSLKHIVIGNHDFDYSLPNDKEINQFIFKVYNETSKKLSFYFFTTSEESFIMNEDKNSSFIMTIYGSGENCQVLHEDYYRIPISGQVEKVSSEPYYSKPSFDSIWCEVEERVPIPNISHPVFILQDSAGISHDSQYCVEILKDLKTKFIELSPPVNTEIISTIKLKSRCKYSCKLYRVDKNDKMFAVSGVSKSSLELKTGNSMTDVAELHNKATRYVDGQEVYQVKYLYRNKPSTHPTIIESKTTGILKKYIKDNNGDPFSSINKNICGLHFSATPQTKSGDLPGSSYFGDYRIMIVPQYLVEGCNLYFADFFCMRRIHWVTLVLTKPGSDEDKFCQTRLVKLDLQNNKYFYNSENGYMVTCLDVEILYTEDINLKEMRLKIGFQERNTPIRGKGSSKTNGVPKNSLCGTCTLPTY